MALTYEQEAVLVPLLARGESHRVIGSIMNVAHTTVRRWLDADPTLASRVEQARSAHEAEQAALAAQRARDRVVVERGEDRPEAVRTEPHAAPARVSRGGYGRVGIIKPGRETRYRDWIAAKDVARERPFEMRLRDDLGREQGHGFFDRDEALRLQAAGWEQI